MVYVLPVAHHPVNQQLQLPGSKSLTNRFLLLAALCNQPTKIYQPLWADDTRRMYQALEQLGVHLVTCDNFIEIQTPIIPVPDYKVIHCGQSGTVARLLIPACIALGGNYLFQADTQLQKRPISPLLETLQQRGMIWWSGEAHWPLKLSQNHKLSGGRWTIDAQLSSQFISGLMIAALEAQSPVTLTVSNNNFRRSYVAMTQKLIHLFSGCVEQINDQQFYIEPSFSLKSPEIVTIEPDASTSSYFLAAAAITGGQVTLKNVNLSNSTQSDWYFLTILEQMNCQIIRDHKKEQVTVIGPRILKGIEVNMHDCSDVFMTVAALAPYAQSASLITGIKHTRYQECDRVVAVAEEWSKLGVPVEVGEDWIKISPAQPKANAVSSHDDHRIAMALSVLALKVPHVELTGEKAVNKTCPDFFQRWANLLS